MAERVYIIYNIRSVEQLFVTHVTSCSLDMSKLRCHVVSHCSPCWQTTRELADHLIVESTYIKQQVDSFVSALRKSPTVAWAYQVLAETLYNWTVSKHLYWTVS